MPDYVTLETVCTENIITDCTQTRHLVIVYRDEDCAFVGKQLTQEYKARIHHAEPFVVAREILTLSTDNLAKPAEYVGVVDIIVVTPFLIAGVIWWVDIDTVNASFIFRKERFECSKIITVNYLIARSAGRSAVRAFAIEAIAMLQYAKRHIGVMGDNLLFTYPVE